MVAALKVLSAVFWAWHVNTLLWCFFLGVNLKMDLAVNRLPSAMGSTLYSTLPPITTPSPSIQVIWNVIQWNEWTFPQITFWFCIYIYIHVYVCTSAAGFPPTDTHSSSTSLSSVVSRTGPWRIFGGSGGTKTDNWANLDRIPTCPENFIVKNLRRILLMTFSNVNGID